MSCATSGSVHRVARKPCDSGGRARNRPRRFLWAAESLPVRRVCGLALRSASPPATRHRLPPGNRARTDAQTPGRLADAPSGPEHRRPTPTPGLQLGLRSLGPHRIPLSAIFIGSPRLFLCQMRDSPAQSDLRASGGSYSHKGMHMTWMERVRNRAPKAAKTGQKRAKRGSKTAKNH
jgi:hypothetical protein